jgi:hypothetical protein
VSEKNIEFIGISDTCPRDIILTDYGATEMSHMAEEYHVTAVKKRLQFNFNKDGYILS